jgi:hypothetical protein
MNGVQTHNFIGDKSNYHTIMTTTVPNFYGYIENRILVYI